MVLIKKIYLNYFCLIVGIALLIFIDKTEPAGTFGSIVVLSCVLSFLLAFLIGNNILRVIAEFFKSIF